MFPSAQALTAPRPLVFNICSKATAFIEYYFVREEIAFVTFVVVEVLVDTLD
jgi:hypothetical protein